MTDGIWFGPSRVLYLGVTRNPLARTGRSLLSLRLRERARAERREPSLRRADPIRGLIIIA